MSIIKYHKAKKSLNDLDLFTKGQPVDFYKELRDNAPVYFHDSMPIHSRYSCISVFINY